MLIFAARSIIRSFQNNALILPVTTLTIWLASLLVGPPYRLGRARDTVTSETRIMGGVRALGESGRR